VAIATGRAGAGCRAGQLHAPSIAAGGGPPSQALAFAVIVEQFIEAAESHCPHLLDVHHGRHLQHVIEATEIDLISGV
jgi:hypothetical protein